MHYDDADIQQCEGCQFREIPYNAEQAFGHTRCSTHRPCTGRVFWEPDNCTHCVRLEDDLKVLNSKSRYTQLGRLKALLNEVKRKVELREPLKRWHYLPIFEYKFKKFGIFQPETDQPETETVTADDGLESTSPSHSDTLIINNDEDDQSDQDSDQEEDPGPPNENVDYDNNQIVDDICTTFSCVRKDITRDCDDPVHAQDVDPNTPRFRFVPNNNGDSRNKRSRSPEPTLDALYNAAKAFRRSPSPMATKASKKSFSKLPKPECQIDAFTGKNLDSI